ncbi:hypothetical protein Tco_0611784 [Tanacetum coccineum]
MGRRRLFYYQIEDPKQVKRLRFLSGLFVLTIYRLVGNLCTIWIGRFHLHANVARFERANKPVKPLGPSQSNAHGTFGSFVSAARDFPPLIASVAHVSSSPALVLDDSCVVERDLSCHVMGRVKDINSIPNLRILLAKEGFEHVKLSYLGIPLHVWSRETFAKIGNKWGEALDIEDNFGSSFARVIVHTSDDESKHGAKILNDGAQNSDVESDDECNVDGVSETIFSDNVDECNVDGHGKETDKHQSEDPFGFYDLLNKLPAKGVRDASTSLSHPPVLTPKTFFTHANFGKICEDCPS